MKEITLKIPEKNFPFFMELVKKLGFVTIEDTTIEVPEHHKKIIKERLKKLKKEDLLEWNSIGHPANGKYNWINPSRPATDEEIEQMLKECENSSLLSSKEAKKQTLNELKEWRAKK